jgi:electron transport complex protein RnfC
MVVPFFTSVSGKVTSKESLYHPLIGRIVPHFVIANDYQYRRANTLKPLTMDATAAEIVLRIKEGGLTGLGGSGFPTYIKYQSPKNIEYILINGVECEPYLSTDYQAAQIYAQALIQGALLLQRAGEAKKVVIAFKKTKVAIKEALEPFIQAYPDITLVAVPDLYPMGWERTLIRQIFKREYDKLPMEVGIIVSNLTTAIAVRDLVLDGQPVLERIITVSGEAIQRPTNIKIPIGVLMANVVRALGGYTRDDVSAFVGGPMSARAVLDDQFAMQPHFGGFTVLPPVSSQEEPCLRCGACTSNCPAHLQPIEIKLALDSNNTARLMKLDAMKCVECGICTYVCPSKIEVTESVRQAKIRTRMELAKPQTTL